MELQKDASRGLNTNGPLHTRTHTRAHTTGNSSNWLKHTEELMSKVKAGKRIHSRVKYIYFWENVTDFATQNPSERRLPGQGSDALAGPAASPPRPRGAAALLERELGARTVMGPSWTTRPVTSHTAGYRGNSRAVGPLPGLTCFSRGCSHHQPAPLALVAPPRGVTGWLGARGAWGRGPPRAVRHAAARARLVVAIDRSPPEAAAFVTLRKRLDSSPVCCLFATENTFLCLG